MIKQEKQKALAKLSLYAAALFLTLLTMLHFLKPELDPSWRMTSEYEIGRYGWMMQVAFVSLAISCTAMFFAIKSKVANNSGRVGLALLLIAAAGLLIAAFGVSDPITAPLDQQTVHGKIHVIGAMLGIPSFPIAALLISISLDHNPHWSAQRKTIVWIAHLTWLSVILMLVMMFILLPNNGGEFGPSVVIGWPNRLVVLAQSLWLMVMAWAAISMPAKNHESTVERFEI